MRKSFDFVIREPSKSSAAAAAGVANGTAGSGKESGAGKRKGGKAGLAQTMEGQEANEDALLAQVVGAASSGSNSTSAEGNSSGAAAAAATQHEIALANEAIPELEGDSEAELMRVLAKLMEDDAQNRAQSVTRDSSQALANGVTSGAHAETGGGADDDAVFKESYIPRTLNEVYDPERDVEMIRQGQGDKLIYATATGMDQVESRNKAAAAAADSKKADGANAASKNTGDESSSDIESEDDDDSGSDSGSEDENGEKKPRGHRHEDRDAKKERKKAVKEAARERRKTKMPKKEKKAKMKKSGK